MSHVTKDKKSLLTRVRRIKGQAEAIEKALDNDNECIAILQQIAAIRGAVNGLMAELLEGHIRDHLGANETAPDKRREDLEDVIRMVRSYMK